MQDASGGCLEDALILGDAGRITAVGPFAGLRAQAHAPVLDLGEMQLCPGLVNAHTHLGLSHARAQALVLGQGFTAWVKSLVPWLYKPMPAQDLDAALGMLRSCGTACVADVAGPNCASVARGLLAAQLDHLLMLEFFGFGGEGQPDVVLGDPEQDAAAWPLRGQVLPPESWERVSAGGHSLYSTGPGLLSKAKSWCRDRGRLFSLHLAESAGEVELLATGQGEMADFYRRAGVLPADYRPPGVSPVAYAARLGLLDAQTVAVHCVQVSGPDVQTLTASGASICLCPRSNDLLGVGRAPWEAYLRSGATVCLGTDGLCSNHDLDLWNELVFFLERTEERLSTGQALALITRNPAAALGRMADYGTVAPGRRAVFAIVPAAVATLEG